MGHGWAVLAAVAALWWMGCGGPPHHSYGAEEIVPETVATASDTTTTPPPEPARATPPRPPGTRTLFPDRGPPSEDAELRSALIGAVRARLDDWLACFEPTLCDDAEPPRVIVAFTVGAEGRTHDVRVESVLRRIWADGSIAERVGDPDGPLGRCLVAVVEQLVVQLPRSPEVTVRYPFAPDLVDCAGAEQRARER